MILTTILNCSKSCRKRRAGKETTASLLAKIVNTDHLTISDIKRILYVASYTEIGQGDLVDIDTAKKNIATAFPKEFNEANKIAEDEKKTNHLKVQKQITPVTDDQINAEINENRVKIATYLKQLIEIIEKNFLEDKHTIKKMLTKSGITSIKDLAATMPATNTKAKK